MSTMKIWPQVPSKFLKFFAERWVKKFPKIPIESIILYRYSSEFLSGVSVKYAVVFDISENADSSSEKYEQFSEPKDCVWAAGGGLRNCSGISGKRDFLKGL